MPRHSEEGIAILLALFLVVLAMGIVFSGSTLLKSNRTKTETNFVLYGQAVQFARSGLIETTNWFRRQSVQPVMALEPQRDDTADPPVADTDEPEIGLVRDFQINGNIWGRYEVWKAWPLDPDLDRLVWRQQTEAIDVSASRGAAAPGSAWRLRSVGYVYNRVDQSKAFDEAPNQIRATEMLETEIRRLSLTLPGASALLVNDGNGAHVNTYGRIKGL